MTTEIVIDGRDNAIEMALVSDGDVPSLSTVTLVELELDNGTTIDSATYPDAFDLTQTVTAAQAAKPAAQALGVQEGDPKLVLKLGSVGLDAGVYRATLIVYDPGSPNGILWDRRRLKVITD